MSADPPGRDAGSSAPGTTAAPGRARLVRVSCGLVGVLAAVNVVDNLWHPPWWVRALEGAALLAWARWEGLTWSQLGLGRDRLRAGARWGLGVVGVVGGVYVVGLLLPLTRPAFMDVRYDLPVPDGLYKALVVIPLGTVVLEEIAFRSVLWGVLARHLKEWQVLVTTSVLFGFWHVLPSLDLGETNRGVSDAVGGSGTAAVVAGTVAFTAIGGLVFGELRRRSGSVLASAAAHWATNGLGVLFGLVAWRLDRAG
ncbi:MULTISPECIES: CPBP family intramembrane glutamic endopeptidase [unclassified Blastococcus]